jgi:hypothetical protein
VAVRRGSGADSEAYNLARIEDGVVAAIANTADQQRQAGVPPHWFCYITVASADETAESSSGTDGFYPPAGRGSGILRLGLVIPDQIAGAPSVPSPVRQLFASDAPFDAVSCGPLWSRFPLNMQGFAL